MESPSPIRALRESFGITQQEVAQEYGLHRPYFSQIERGRIGVDEPTLAGIKAAIFAVANRKVATFIENGATVEKVAV